MKKWLAVVLAVLALHVGSVVPGEAWERGGGHFHGGHGGHGWWGPGIVLGAFALGAALLTYPIYAAANAASAVAPPPVVVEPAPVVYPPAPQAAPVQREVVYPHGKYVLYGDGVRQAWQWVWIPAVPAPPPPPQP